MATTKITTRQIKGEPNALQSRKSTAVTQTLDIQEGTYGIGKLFPGASNISHPDWVGATSEFYIYLDRFDQLVLNNTLGFPNLSTRIAIITIIDGIIISVSDQRAHVNGVIDGYQVTYVAGASKFVHGNDVQEALDSIDGYLDNIFTPVPAILIRQNGRDAYDTPFNTIFITDGYSYEIGEQRLLVSINGILQYSPLDYRERNNSSIEFFSQIDHDDVVDILILPGSLGGSGNTTNLQEAYNNSTVGQKNINIVSGSPINIVSSNNTALSVIGSGVNPTLFVSNNSGNRALDVSGDGYFHAGVTVTNKVTISTSQAPLNLPILTSDPVSPINGDCWISNVAGIKKIKSRINGVTYSVALAVD